MSICTARRSNGTVCKGQSIRGSNVCRVHGGSAPQVRRKAAERLAALVDPAIGVLAHSMKNKTRQPSVALAAAKDVLDRAGYKPKNEVEITDINGRLEALQAGRERSRKALEELSAS